MMTPKDVAESFYAALVSRDWDAMRKLLYDDATWTLPGDNTLSGTAAG